MTDEIKIEEKKEECKCFCQSKGFRKFLTIALGTFVGVYCALSLFAALHRPPMMPPQGFGFYGGMRGGCPMQVIKHHHFKGDRPDFHKAPQKAVGQRAPFEAQKPDVDD